MILFAIFIQINLKEKFYLRKYVRCVIIMSKIVPGKMRVDTLKVSKDTYFSQIREKSGLSIKEISQHFNKSERTVYRWEKGESAPREFVLKEMEAIYDNYRNIATDKPNFRFIDLFAGIGGLRKAFEAIGGKCVFTCEWDSNCRKTYQANFNCDHPIAGDIRDVNFDDVPNYDVLLAGFPCQPFSIAGVSKKNSLGIPHGFKCDTQGTLFFDVAQMIEHHRPKAFLLENVKNLISHDKGRTFKVILRTLEEELGYNVEYRVLNAKGWVPQHRERIFIVGFLDDVGFSFDKMIIRKPEEGPRIGSILHPQNGLEPTENPYTIGENGKVAEKYTLSDRLWQYLQDYAKKHKEKGNGFGYGSVGPDDVARTLSARYYKDGSEILIKQEGKNPRRLTPRECARLMGFDTVGNKKFIIPVSDTQAYKQFGNSVVVPVIESVAKHMLPYILESSKDSSRRSLYA